MGTPATHEDGAAALLALYDRALPQVYGYLLSRCGTATVAEDLTAETFLAAAATVQGASTRRPGPPTVTTPWLIGVARHKLVDHWRRVGREQRGLAAVAGEPDAPEDRWDVELDALQARATLALLAAHHRAALTLRYLDDLPVAEVAAVLGRTVHATEALLVRARRAFRRQYSGEEATDA